MAQEGRAQLKTYFEKGDKPTEQQFANLIDSCINIIDDGSSSTPDATTTIKGKSELLSDAELDSATPSDNSATTPTESAITLGIRQVYRLWKKIFTVFYTKTEVDSSFERIQYNTPLSSNTNIDTAFGTRYIKNTSGSSINLTPSGVGVTINGSTSPFVLPAGAYCLLKRDPTDSTTYWAFIESTTGGSGATNLGYTASPTNGIVTSDTGTDATLTLVDSTNAGLASPTMKSNWDGKEDSANKSTSTGDSGSSVKFPVWSAIVSYFTASQIRSILGISTLSGSNTGDETNSTILSKLGYTPENSANKDANSGYVGRDSSGGLSVVDATVTSATASTPVFFSSSKKLISLTSALWGTFVQTFTGKTTPVDSDTITIFDSSSTFNTNKTTLTDFWTNYLKPKTDSSYWIRGGNTLSAETILGGTSGAFGIDIRTNNLTALKILSSPTSAVNYLTITSSATNVSPAISAVGSDSIIDVVVTPKGATGYLSVERTGESGIRIKNTTNSNNWIFAIGAGTITSTNNLAFAYNGTSRMTLDSSGNLQPSGGVTVGNYIRPVNVSTGLLINGNTANSGVISNTSGNFFIARLWNEGNNTFSPASGTANLTILDFSAFTVNQTSTASGALYGINWNPTVTSNTGILAVLRSGMADNANRWFLYNDGGAKSYLNGALSIRTTTATAHLTIGGGTISNSALRLLAGSMPTGGNILDGNINYDGSNLRLTVSTTDYTLIKALVGSATLDFPSIAASGYQDLTITVTGAAINDPVTVGEDNATVGANIFYKGWVSATNTVTVRAFNTHPSNSYDPASATFKVIVQKT